MAELGLKDCPWFSQGNKLPVFTSFHFEIFFGFFLDGKLRDLGFHYKNAHFKPLLHARDGTAQVERPASEQTWAAAVKKLSNFQDDGS